MLAPVPKNSFAWRDGLVALLLFVGTLGVFRFSSVSYYGDSKYSLLLSHQLLTRHSFTLDGYGIPREPPVPSGDAYVNGDIYQLEVVGGHLYYYFPPGTSLLSAPFVWVMEHLGMRLVNTDGSYSRSREIEFQVWLAALLMAALTAVFYFTGRLLLPVSWSVGLALGGALGTPVWSTASRAMWTHTWGILLLGVVVYWLLARETGRRRSLPPVLLASVLSWSYFVRPTSSIFIVGITVYLLLYHRAAFVPYAVTGALWFVAFVGYSRVHFGRFLPSYYQANRLEFGSFWEGLAGNLVSPSRGLLVQVPVLLWVAYLLVRHRRQQPPDFPRLVWLALAMCAGHLAAVSCFVPWNGGFCFGPRYTTELVPWMVLLGALGLHALRRWGEEQTVPGVVGRSTGQWHATLACGGIVLAASGFIHWRGANALATVRWNDHPVSVDEVPGRVWDWRSPQFLAGLVKPPPPTEWPEMPRGRLSFGKGAARAFQYAGWSDSEAKFCWTEERRATLVFAAADPSASRLRVKFSPLLKKGQRAQRVEIVLNSQRVASLEATEARPQEYAVALPAGALQARNVLEFNLPDAATHWTPKHGYDPRLLGIAVQWLELDTPPPVGTPAETLGNGGDSVAP